MSSRKTFIIGLWAVMTIVTVTLLMLTVFADRADAASRTAAVERACKTAAAGQAPHAACPAAPGIIRVLFRLDNADDGDRISWNIKCATRTKPFTGAFVVNPLYATTWTVDAKSGHKKAFDTMSNDTCVVKARVERLSSAKSTVWLTLTVGVRTA